MNQLPAQITEIKTSGEIALITLRCGGETFSSLIIHNNEAFIKKGNEVVMAFKETEVAIAKNLNGLLSIRNRFQSTITSIEKGTLLSEITLNFKGNKLVSIITTASCENMELTVGDEVEALLKTNELLLMNKTATNE